MNRFAIRNTATEIESEASTCDAWVCRDLRRALHMQRTCSLRFVVRRAVGCMRSICVPHCARLPSAFFPAFRLYKIVAYNEPCTYRKIDKWPAARRNPRPRLVTKYKEKFSCNIVVAITDIASLLHPLPSFFLYFFISLRNRACRLYGHLPLT